MALRTISIFPTRSSEGAKLADRISRHFSMQDTVVRVYDRREEFVSDSIVFSAILTDNLVIFDATRENEDNFDIALPPLARFPHVVIISRNYLPEDFDGWQYGFYPSYNEKTKNSDEIFAYLVTNTTHLLGQREVFERYTSANKRSTTVRLSEMRRATMSGSTAFISFRTRFQTDVEALARRISSGHYGVDISAHFLGNGALVFSDEILTEHRRWDLIRRLSILIEDCDQFWIYLTEDYFNSWWTLGEICSLLLADWKGKRKRIVIYDPRSDTVTDVPMESLPRLEPYQISYLFARQEALDASMQTMHQKISRLVHRILVTPLGVFNPVAWVFCILVRAAGSLHADLRPMLSRFSLEEYVRLMTSKRHWQDTRMFALYEDYWNKKEIIMSTETNAVPAWEAGLRIMINLGRFFDFSGFERVSVLDDDISRGVIEINGKTHKIVQEAPRYRLRISGNGRALQEVDVVRVIGI